MTATITIAIDNMRASIDAPSGEVVALVDLIDKRDGSIITADHEIRWPIGDAARLGLISTEPNLDA